MRTKNVFGPVPSRRLGRSLGIDLVPFKTCTFDCIYCQLGRTTHKTLDRREFVTPSTVLEEVAGKLASSPKADYLTISGSGEPTLHTGIEEVIAGLKQLTSVPVAVLTNGSLFWLPEVRRAVRAADVVIPSLDAGDDALFAYVNRPHPDLVFERVVEGLTALREEYKGKIWIEIFLLGGVTAIEAEVDKIARLVDRIRPDKVQLNSVVRPPAETFALAVPPAEMTRLAARFGKGGEVIADYANHVLDDDFVSCSEEILALLKRRPCTVQDLAAGLSVHLNEVLKYIQELMEAGKIEALTQEGVVYYTYSR